MREYKYGMRLRGFAPLCQPKEGLIRSDGDPSGKYYNIISYNRKLDNKEIFQYDLEYIPNKRFRITYEIVFDVFAYTEDEAIEEAEMMLAEGSFSYPTEVEEIEDEDY